MIKSDESVKAPRNPLVQSLQRADQIMEAVSLRGELGVRELSSELGLAKTTIHRLLTSLVSVGYLEQNPDTRRYRLSIRLFELGSRVLGRYGLRDEAREFLVDLHQRTGDTILLAVRDGASVIYIDRVGSVHQGHAESRVGTRFPLHATASGKALLAWLPTEERWEILGHQPLDKLTERTVTQCQEMEEHLARARRTGFALVDGERIPGVRALSAPVRDHSGAVLASLTVVTATELLPDSRIPEVGLMLLDAAWNLSRRLGYQGKRRNGMPDPHEER